MKNWKKMGEAIENLCDLVDCYAQKSTEIIPFDSGLIYSSQELFDHCSALLDKLDQLHANSQNGIIWAKQADTINWGLDEIQSLFTKALAKRESELGCSHGSKGENG